VLVACQVNFIQDLKGLDTLVNLEELYLQQNQVKSFDGLQNNHKLEMLDLAVNKLSQFEMLDHLSGTLKELWLNWNNFEDTQQNRDYLSIFKKLETIYLADNPVANVDNYQKML